MIKLLLVILVLGFTACSKNRDVNKSNVKSGEAVNQVDKKTRGVDVRSLQETKDNPAPGSVHIEMSDIADQFESQFVDKDEQIAVFCEAGGRAEKVREFLISKGYKRIKNIGSWREWNEIHAE